jgi:hypothetical protein
MSAFPTFPRSAFLFWCQEHAPIWSAAGGDIGMSDGQASDFAAKSAAAASALSAQVAAIQAARAATLAASDAFRDLRRAAGDGVRTIRAFAELQPKPSVVYTLAQIPAPASPSPAPPPGKPFQLVVGLLDTGALHLRWKCQNPANTGGTVYEVMRRTGSSGPFTYVGAVGLKKFTDESVPSGVANVQYQITAVRSTVRGLPAQFNINFGTGGGGGFVVTSVTEVGGAEVKMAA